MNQQERQALRDIHTKVTGFTDGKEIVPYCLGCGDYIDDDRQPYPCDVIKILDAWDSDVGRNYEPTRTPNETDWNFRYCPNCGKKLKEKN
jgi:predicted RNA-binding Zn-ribbon protein involved in translation (DUF1610 family)